MVAVATINTLPQSAVKPSQGMPKKKSSSESSDGLSVESFNPARVRFAEGVQEHEDKGDAQEVPPASMGDQKLP